MKSNQLGPRRGGYALLMCLMVVAVTSSIVLTLFQALRLQTAESQGRRQIVINNSLAEGAFEHALAILLENPNYIDKKTYQVPTSPSHSYTLDIQQDSQNILVTAALKAGASNTFFSRTYSKADLKQRRLELGLK